MDRRDRMASEDSWYESFDKNRMIATMELYNDNDEEEEIEIPCKMEVCETCHGKGTHVNPSIDSHGLTAEDFAEDPDFAEDYLSGTYDVTCYECHGANVVPQIDWSSLSPELKKRLESYFEAKHQARLADEYERRMGC